MQYMYLILRVLNLDIPERRVILPATHRILLIAFFTTHFSIFALPIHPTLILERIIHMVVFLIQVFLSGALSQNALGRRIVSDVVYPGEPSELRLVWRVLDYVVVDVAVVLYVRHYLLVFSSRRQCYHVYLVLISYKVY